MGDGWWVLSSPGQIIGRKLRQGAQGLLAVKGGFEIIGDEDFAALIDRFCADREALRRAGEEAGRFVKSRSGASDIILSGISL